MLSSELDVAHQEIQDRVDFEQFRSMFQHLPLWKFVYSEKWRFSGPFDETRNVVDESGEVVSGYRLDTTIALDAMYKPGYCQPFPIKGIWLPLEDGKLFGLTDDIAQCPLMREHNGKQELLFLIHPLSETLYAKLLAAHSEHVLIFQALALSSSRTLLIAFPDPITKGYVPLMVKLSLDATLQGVRRLVTERECAISVANTSILTNQIRDLDTSFDCMRDPVAFVPQGYEGGMIYRELPDSLNPTKPNEHGFYLMPLLALYGNKNQPWLHALTLANGGTFTHFLTRRLLQPFMAIFLQLVLRHKTSIEAHGQNLLLKLDRHDQVCGLVYRDMGGVNYCFTQAELLALPSNMRELVTFYNPNFAKDAGTALEDHFITRGLFPLSKQCCKSSALQEQDPALRQWLADHKNYQINWTLMDEDVADERHQTHLRATEFYRYGYVETECLYVFLSYIKRQQLVKKDDMEAFYARCSKIKLPDGTIVAPHSTEPFFTGVLKTLVKPQVSVLPVDEPLRAPSASQQKAIGFFSAKDAKRSSLKNIGIILLISGVGSIAMTLLLCPSAMLGIGLFISMLLLIAGAVCVESSRVKNMCI